MVLSQMYNVDVVIIRPDFVWLSRAVAPITCGIVLVQDSSGNFLGTKTKNPVYIGLVPKIPLPDPNVIRAKLHKIRHQSTLNRPIRSQNEAFRKFGGGLLLIVENSSRKSQANKEVVARQNLLGEDSSSSTSLLRRNIRQFEEQNLRQMAEDSEEGKDLSTTIDPNEAFAEDGQQNDIESSHDQETRETSVTKDDSEQMSGTFDIGGTDTSTLVNTQSKEETDTTTTTSEEDKMETADPSVENYDSPDEDISKDDNEDDDNEENSLEGEGEEGIQESTKESDEADEDIEKDEKDSKSAEGEDDKVISDGTKNKPEENKADVNTASNEIAENSDDIIPSENTQPEEESASITVSKMEMAQSETTNKSADTEIIQLSAIESMDVSNTQNNEDGKKPVMKRRLGMGEPAFMKRMLQVKMQDISTDSDKSPKTPQTKEMKGGNKSVMRKLMCMKCLEMFFMQEGYQRHLFKDHKVRCFEKHPPQVIEKTVTRYSQETYETNYRVVNTKDSDKGGQPVINTDRTSQQANMTEEENAKKTVEEDVNVKTKSGEEAKSNKNDENIENIYVSSDGK